MTALTLKNFAIFTWDNPYPTWDDNRSEMKIVETMKRTLLGTPKPEALAKPKA